MRGKRRFRQFCEWRESSDRCRDGSVLFLSVPGSSLPLAQLHGRPHVSKTKHAAGAATFTSVSINQPSLAIAFPFLSPSLSHTDCINQGLDQEEVVTGVQNEKGLSYCRRSRQTVEGHLQSRRKITALSAPFTCLCRRLQRFSRESRCVYTWTLCTFLSKGEKNAVCCSKSYRGSTSLTREVSARWSRVFICEI